MKTAIVTGASSGIGAMVAQMLHSEGWKVYGLSRTKPPREQIEWRKVDLTDPDHAASCLRGIHPIDAIVHAAFAYEPVESLRDVGANALFRLVDQADSRLKESKGVVIVVSSVAAEFPAPDSAYAADKQEQERFGLALAGSGQIRCNIVRPGYVEGTRTWPNTGATAAQVALGNIPLGRFASPLEVASAIYFLMGHPYLNGAILTVDGGWSARRRIVGKTDSV